MGPKPADKTVADYCASLPEVATKYNPECNGEGVDESVSATNGGGDGDEADDEVAGGGKADNESGGGSGGGGGVLGGSSGESISGTTVFTKWIPILLAIYY